jgi:hypothetical protein
MRYKTYLCRDHFRTLQKRKFKLSETTGSRATPLNQRASTEPGATNLWKRLRPSKNVTRPFAAAKVTQAKYPSH